jgi:hypothetical protein
VGRKDRTEYTGSHRAVDRRLLGPDRTSTLVADQTVLTKVTRSERVRIRLGQLRQRRLAMLGWVSLTLALTVPPTIVVVATAFFGDDKPAVDTKRATDKPAVDDKRADKTQPAETSAPSPSPRKRLTPAQSSAPAPSPTVDHSARPRSSEPRSTPTPTAAETSAPPSGPGLVVPVSVHVDVGFELVLVYEPIGGGPDDAGAIPCAARADDRFDCTLDTAGLAAGVRYRVTTHVVARADLVGLLAGTVLAAGNSVTEPQIVSGPR